MTRQRLGELMLHWHSGATDPVYLAGSYYVADRVYPEQMVVEAALNYLRGSLASLDHTRDQSDRIVPEARQELTVLIYELLRLMKQDYPSIN